MVDIPSIWEPLNQTKREIRLLLLAPSEHIDDQVECFLETISLDRYPEYKVLVLHLGRPKGHSAD